MSISIRFPFRETQKGGVFDANSTSSEALGTNLISLLTMKRKQRVMHNSFYSPLWDYIHEPWDEISEETLRGDLISKINEWIPQVSVKLILFKFEPNGNSNLLEVKVVYTIPSLGDVEDSVLLEIPVAQAA